MMKKSFWLIAALAFSAILSMAHTNSYEILLTKTTQAGEMQLAAGQYRLTLDGANAIFTSVETNHSFVAPVKVETTHQHDVTSIEVKDAHITSIELGGSTETLEFGE
ncbi:MAG TPA: hypothetical protein VKB88_07460 [Bryobacteraceae bacterium]|nr:hypothetical protein [Bryobacteraceae bacterium]